jgi:1-acyl-sn-glycerol-3-phosphate acyltransferase
MPLVVPIFGRRTFTKMFTHAANIIWTIMTIEFEWKVAGKKVRFYGDILPLHQNAIVICNHRSVIDWLLLFSLARRKGRLGCAKFFVKKSLKWVPGVGWGMYFLDYVFLHRNWNKDRVRIERAFAKLKSRKLPFWLITFPEGTRRSSKKLEESQRYERANGLFEFRHLLYPRTKGFIGMVNGLRDAVSDIYDITIEYDGRNGEPTISDLAFGTIPTPHIHIKRYAISSLPRDDAGIADWLVERWKEKEKLLDDWKVNKAFPNPIEEPNIFPPMKLDAGNR